MVIWDDYNSLYMFYVCFKFVYSLQLDLYTVLDGKCSHYVTQNNLGN